MKIAVIQFAPALCDREETIRRVDPMLEEASGADLIVLPELANSGYSFPDRRAAWEASEPVASSPFLEYLTGMCEAHACDIVTGLCERAVDRLYNSAVLLSARGVEGIYRKLHLFMDEPDIFEPGDLGLPVFERDYGTIGIQICFDWALCEPWRILMLKGAELICHPSNLVIPGKAQRAIPVYAMTNRLFIVTANRIGTEGSLTFTGRSLIADPEGGTLAEASQREATTLVVDVDLSQAQNKALTPRNDAIADRRPDQYGELCAWDRGLISTRRSRPGLTRLF
jgi:predicted amidohydrolase